MGLTEIARAGEGVFFALIAAVGFSVFPSLARLAANAGVPDFQVVLVNELTNAAVFLPSLLICRAPLTGQNRKQTLGFVCTGVMRVCSTTMAVLSYLYIPPAATVAISNGSSPLFAVLLSWLILKERAGWVNIAGVAVQVVAVGLVAGGTHLRTTELSDLAISGSAEYWNVTTNITATTTTMATNTTTTTMLTDLAISMDHWNVTTKITTRTTTTTATNTMRYSDTRNFIIGVVLGLAGALGLNTTNVLSRKFLRKVSQLTVLAYVESLGFLLVFPAMYIINTPKWNLDIRVVCILLGQGITYTVSIACLYRSLKLQKASTVQVLRGLSVALAYVFQYLILDVVALLMEYIGAAIIIVSIVIVAGYKWYKAYQTDTYEVEAQVTSIYTVSARVIQGASNPCVETVSFKGNVDFEKQIRCHQKLGN